MTPCTSKGYRGPTLTQTILPQTVSVQWVFIFFFGIFSECRDMLFTKKNMYLQSTIKVFIYKETAINISAFSIKPSGVIFDLIVCLSVQQSWVLY